MDERVNKAVLSRMSRERFLRLGALGLAGLFLSRLVARAESGMEYVVRSGDTLSVIARRHGVSLADLRNANGLRGDRILVGQRLMIPESGTAYMVHTVRPGESLSVIARRHGVTVAEVRAANGISGDLIRPGQELRVPRKSVAPAGRQYIRRVVEATRRITVEKSRWQTIVGHHSGVDRGNAAIYDRFHRRERRMENGLAYHFVIGNGRDSGDGEIEIGDRWLRQIHGGHVRNHAVNMTSIGICVVGNFESSRPSFRQVAAFRELVDYLRNELLVGRPVDFAVHREIDRNHTVCPGRYFPTAAMHRRYG